MSIEDRIATVFEKVFGMNAKGFSPDIVPEDVAHWDSVGHMNLMMNLEDTFGVHFEVDEITEMSSGGKIIEMLRAKGVRD